MAPGQMTPNRPRLVNGEDGGMQVSLKRDVQSAEPPKQVTRRGGPTAINQLRFARNRHSDILPSRTAFHQRRPDLPSPRAAATGGECRTGVAGNRGLDE
jgi:hypothetical protein